MSNTCILNGEHKNLPNSTSKQWIKVFIKFCDENKTKIKQNGVKKNRYETFQKTFFFSNVHQNYQG